MNYPVTCPNCCFTIWIRGEAEDETNALELHEEDPNWEDACEHIKAGGKYAIGAGESCGDEDFE